jgi:hypothetical protein
MTGMDRTLPWNILVDVVDLIWLEHRQYRESPWNSQWT